MLQQVLQGSLVNALTASLRELELPDGPAHPSSCHGFDDRDNDSDDDQPSHAKFKALRKSKGTTSLQRGGTSRIPKLEINFEDPCASVDFLDCMCNTDILQLQMCTAGICAVISRSNKFTDGMVCAICGDK